MKIHILHKIRKGPWGGGNQFLKSLREMFRKKGIYEERPQDADMILFNSHQELEKALSIKRSYSEILFVHRVDGPISRIRESSRVIDTTIYWMNQALADGTVFQSNWSRDRNREMGMPVNRFETVILNAPDPEIFRLKDKASPDYQQKTKLINTSWSSHMNKGFEVYKWLDEHLDFSQYEMTFIGRSPYIFKNIRQIDPLPTEDLAEQLKMHDIFITASKSDPCSNSLIEALHCGLPALALRDGGHPEIVSRGGELFDRPEEIPAKLDRMKEKYKEYREEIHVPGLDQVNAAYEAFMKRVHRARAEGIYKAKTVPTSTWARGRLSLLKWTLSHKMERLRSVLGRSRVRESG
jgi:glycosyltransferase involved in cell wall biosynthesis